ncbi:MAG: hypothetical protein J5744_03260 [Oscillospiraceae bacterium]|nr:hypothetical protein [Oscillospiraceae bacterium]
MESKLTKAIRISPSMCDSSGRLGIPDTASLFMDIAAEHSDRLGIGQIKLKSEGGFWLTIKTIMRFYRKPGFSEEAELSTWPEYPEKRRCYRDYLLSGTDGPLAAGKTEWGILDMDTGRLRHLDSIYPAGLELSDISALSDEFVRFDEDMSADDILGTFIVRSTDIDLGNHMNNVAYIRAFASLFSSSDWNRMDIKFIEIWYRSQSLEGDVITARKRERGDCSEVSFFKEDGTCTAQIRYRCGS